MPLEALTAVSSIDGRYRGVAEKLLSQFSEFALIKNRVFVECEYLIALSEVSTLGMRKLNAREKALLRQLPEISIADARMVKAIEKEGYKKIPATNHDVKAVEYFIKQKIEDTSLSDIGEWIHFALTSEDVNSVAHALALRSALVDVLLPAIGEIETTLHSLATKHAKSAMLARTHGQSASPTTFGKEMKVFAARLERQIDSIEKSTVLVKWGGATGNYNAHVAGAPEVNWRSFTRKFVGGLNRRLSATQKQVPLELNEYTTQIEPHDTYAEMFDSLRRINTILIDLSQDMWRYISDGWVTQKPKAGEVGSSTMPHKVNPIDFENAEGNFGVANALFEHFSRKLPISRLQRDLSDSTVERVFGTAFAHSLIGYTSLSRGFSKVSVNTESILRTLQEHPEVLAEAIQTALRREKVAVPYEKLKELTRGRTVTLDDFAVFIESLDISSKTKKRLKELRPETYIGLSTDIAKGDS